MRMITVQAIGKKAKYNEVVNVCRNSKNFFERFLLPTKTEKKDLISDYINIHLKEI